MKASKPEHTRRNFLKTCSLSTASMLLPAVGMQAMSSIARPNEIKDTNTPKVNFVYDGPDFTPQEYIEKLNLIQQEKGIQPDFYFKGGATQQLEKEFAKLTGKEKAIYVPTGTMANQLAIKLLNGNNTKVIVPENSHIFRDEADAAQSVHNKRLIPVGKGKSYFDVTDLENSINYINDGEAFKSGLGTVVIENPVRRAYGTVVPLEKIKEISAYCKENNYKMHLDGARIHLASAYHNSSLAEYASYFDTVYISLYKYLNAAGGAILCGDAEVIDQISHQIKILGGTIFQSWYNTAMASYYLNGIEDRWSKLKGIANKLITELNQIDGVTISSLEHGTNIFQLKLSSDIGLRQLDNYLYEQHGILIGRANKEGIIKFAINESLFRRDTTEIVEAWKKGIEHAKG